jgi:hypothetical protein
LGAEYAPAADAPAAELHEFLKSRRHKAYAHTDAASGRRIKEEVLLGTGEATAVVVEWEEEWLPFPRLSGLKGRAAGRSLTMAPLEAPRTAVTAPKWPPVRCVTSRHEGRDSGLMETEDVFRDANDRIAEKAAELAWHDPIPFLCECSDNRCFARVELTLDEYGSVRARPEQYLMKPGHQLSGGFVLEQDGRLAVAEKLSAEHGS